ncbi:enoyl-ACP reductase FabI [Derxia lacustris]|uniref:enoyl-ACP reductase FabI n=1 Tax=Derxia lacustris TaxID=764842 RepID=UPI000A176BE6|nr:enoyl-ACP reductase FabI [Derxia lacustris]
MQMLEGLKALVVGVANDQSIAWGCARAFRAAGAELAITYLNDKARPHVEPLAQQLEAPIFLPLDVVDDAQTDAVFAEIERRWGRLDVLLHSIAFCPKDDLHGRVVDCSRDGFAQAMDISVHSFMRLVKRAEPLMSAGGSCLTVTYYGSTRVVDTYNVMGPVKAALEAVTREMATELGGKGIRVNALSPGPLKTRAASGIDHFDDLMRLAAERAPTHQLATIDDVGAYATFLASPGARNVTGTVPIIDGGFHITS